MLFNEAYELEYSLEIVSRTANTRDVNSVQCKFCIVFEKKVGRQHYDHLSKKEGHRKYQVFYKIFQS